MKTLTRIVTTIVLNGLALYGIIYFVETITYTGGVQFFIISAIILGILNLIIKPVLKLVSLPLVIISGGVFLIIINVVLLWLLKYILGIIKFRDVMLNIPDFTDYLFAAIILGVFNWIIHLFFKFKQ